MDLDRCRGSRRYFVAMDTRKVRTTGIRRAPYGFCLGLFCGLAIGVERNARTTHAVDERYQRDQRDHCDRRNLANRIAIDDDQVVGGARGFGFDD